MPAAELQPLLEAYGRHHPNGKPERLDRAYELAKEMHAGQMRQTGDPYISHPLAVAEILAEYGMGSQTLAAALLHDVVEDTPLTLDDVRNEFGDTVADLIDGVTKMDRVKFSSREEQQAATIRKLAIAMAADIRFPRRSSSGLPARRSMCTPLWPIASGCRRSSTSSRIGASPCSTPSVLPRSTT